ncbi:MAG: hypothetical protein K1X88_09430 [Nannocystaceae bacterium]|nr:hypothetical protein [Nannocystaceae bacterium]
MPHTSLRPFSLLSLAACAALLACDGDDDPGGGGAVTKQDAGQADGKKDASDDLCQEIGKPAGCDLCGELGWYGDGACDDFCSQPDPDCGGVAQPSASCRTAAAALLAELGPLSSSAGTVASFELVDALSDHELIRATMTPDPDAEPGSEPEQWMINAETLGGDPCLIYGAQLVSQEIDLQDQGGAPVGKPSAACSDAAKAAITAVADVDGQSPALGAVELVDGFSDRELLRVSLTDDDGDADSYLVNTESLGGDPCLVYGLQLRSQQIDLRVGTR